MLYKRFYFTYFPNIHHLSTVFFLFQDPMIHFLISLGFFHNYSSCDDMMDFTKVTDKY